jgi:ANTAR domain
VVDRGVAESGRRAAGYPGALREDVVIRRTSAGWRVEGSFPSLPTDTVDELGHALALADLLAEGTVPGPRPPRPADGLDEVARLRASVRQLEHALASRVVVEQAIGVLTERWRVAPRDAFEQLRRITRSRGLRIHDMARQVIASCTDPDVALPAELVPTPRPAGTPPAPRQSPDRRVRADGGGERRESRRSRRDRGRGAGPARPEPGEDGQVGRYGRPGSLPPGTAAKTDPPEAPVHAGRPSSGTPAPNGAVSGSTAPATPAAPVHGRHARVEQ